MNGEARKSEPAEIRPFPGLRAFEESEDYLFFGRDGQSEDILSALGRSRLLAVVGASGSGKSSLIKAGLIPYLHGGFLDPSGGGWRVAVMRPGADPIGALARAVVGQDWLSLKPEDADELQQRVLLTIATLRRGGLGLVDTVRLARLPQSENLLLVVDQFEELFRFGEAAGVARGGDDAAAFVKLLMEATRQTQVPIYVVLTMRSDFIGDCARFRDLPETVTQGLYLVPRLTRAQRREVIEGPIRVAGGAVAPRLVTRVLNDIGDDPDQLPILQHAMMRAWDRWKANGAPGRPLDLEDYEAIGGAARALSDHADEVFDALDARGKEIAQRMFQALTEKDAENRDSRRPTTLGAIAEIAGASVSETAAVVERFRAPGQSFLMPPPPAPLGPETAIDISHESLIRGWRRLRGWVDSEAESARVYKRLAETAALHAEGKAGLWRDPDLAVALAWRQREAPSATWAKRYEGNWELASQFLSASLEARDAAARREMEAARAELARTRRRLAILLGAFVGVVLFAGLSYYSFREAQTAAQQADAARKQAVAAQSQTEAALKQVADEAEAEREAADAADAAKRQAEASERLANEQKVKAEAEAARAAAAARDLIADADRARAQELALADQIRQTSEAALSFMPSDLASFMRLLRLQANLARGNFAQANDEINEISALGVQQGTAFAGGAYAALYLGAAERAAADARAFLEQDKSPILFGDLAVALTMEGDTAHALQALDDALAHVKGEVKAIMQEISPDIYLATHHRVLYAVGDDLPIAARYFRAVVLSVDSEDRLNDFLAALRAADAASGAAEKPRPDEDRLSAETPLLIAINFAWLAGRGQAVNIPRDREAGLTPNYGLFAAQGALWERVGRLEPRYFYNAKKSYEAFQTAFADAPQERYRNLADWVSDRSRTREIADAVDYYGPADDNALALQAQELYNVAARFTYFDLKPALDLLTKSIDALRAKDEAGLAAGEDPSSMRQMRDRYLLSERYALRSLWRLQAVDLNGARADAEIAIANDPANALAYVYRGSITPETALADYEKALELEPSNAWAADGVASQTQDKDPQRAIAALELKRQYSFLRFDNYQTLAAAYANLKDFDKAKDALAKAIALQPESSQLCDQQRTLDVQSGKVAAIAAARRASCLRAAGETAARLGHREKAVKFYIQALNASAVEGPDPSGDLAFEAQAASRALGEYLSTTFGHDAAVSFWNSFADAAAANPAKARAAAELARLNPQ